MDVDVPHEVQPTSNRPHLYERDSVISDFQNFLVVSQDSFRRLRYDSGRLRFLVEPDENLLVFKSLFVHICHNDSVQLNATP